MLDMGFLRAESERVKQAVRDRGEQADIDGLLTLDESHRRLLHECEQLRAEQNDVSRQIGRAKGEGRDLSSLISRARDLAQRIGVHEQKLRDIERQIEPLALRIPNIPAPDVPVGPASANELVRSWGPQQSFDFVPLPHWDLGKRLGLLNFERASKTAGRGFVVFERDGARLKRALVNFLLDLHTRDHGFVELSPPFLANRASTTGTGQLPKMDGKMYETVEDDLFLIPRGEVSATNLHRDEVLHYQDLPLCYVTHNPCFRREAGSHGKDTRGLARLHQFDDVQLVKFTRPESSYDELESLVACAERAAQLLGLHYRVWNLSTGSLSFAATKCYSIEVWAPGMGRYLEVSSCGHYGDFQARRCNIRYRDEDGRIRFVHTINGNALALARTFAAIIETYQESDGSVAIPEVLRPYVHRSVDVPCS